MIDCVTPARAGIRPSKRPAEMFSAGRLLVLGLSRGAVLIRRAPVRLSKRAPRTVKLPKMGAVLERLGNSVRIIGAASGSIAAPSVLHCGEDVPGRDADGLEVHWNPFLFVAL